MNTIHLAGALALAVLPVSMSIAEQPDIFAAPGETLVATLQAQGAQVYDCKPDTAGKLVWQFRELIATLFENGRTVGRHYAGPSWEIDGAVITGKVAERASGTTAKDIPLLKLEVTSRRGTGWLPDVTTIQRLNTRGGAAGRGCEIAGAFLSVPYSADYAFYSKSSRPLAPNSLQGARQ